MMLWQYFPKPVFDQFCLIVPCLQRRSSPSSYVPSNTTFPRLSESSGLTLGLEQAQDVVLTDGSLDVSDDATGLVVHELDANLGDTTTGTSSAQDTGDLDKLDGLLSGIHLGD